MLPGDLPQVIDIASSLPHAPRWPAATYLHALHPESRPPRLALVCEHPPSHLVGFLVALLIPPQAELETIAVAQPAQRQDIGSLLVDALFDHLKTRHITEVQLEVRESNVTARAFYASAGFTETARRKGYYSDPKEDAILLSRTHP